METTQARIDADRACLAANHTFAATQPSQPSVPERFDQGPAATLRTLLVPDGQPSGFGQLERRAFSVLVLAALGAGIVVARIRDGIDLSDGVRCVLYADTALNHNVIMTGLYERHRTLRLRVTNV